MSAGPLLIGIIVGLGLLILFALPAPRRSPTRTHRGLELMAKEGHLVHVRETESEREL